MERQSLFQHLTPEQLAQISVQLRRQTFPAGTTILTIEQPSEVVYLIERGAVKIHLEQMDGTDVILAILAAGDVLGEMGLMDAMARSASAVTLEETVCWWMERAAFQQWLSPDNFDAQGKQRTALSELTRPLLPRVG